VYAEMENVGKGSRGYVGKEGLLVKGGCW